MNKIIPLLFVLCIVVFCLIFWRFVLALVSLLFKLIAAIFFIGLFR